MNKPTVILGASNNPERYAYKATKMLIEYGHTVYPVGVREGKINGIDIIVQKQVFENIDTVTLYVGPANQPSWYDYILSLKPKRIIFNPGTENPDLVKLASEKNIECTEACTLVLLTINNY
jgi:predicted CoA-binding protein